MRSLCSSLWVSSVSDSSNPSARGFPKAILTSHLHNKFPLQPKLNPIIFSYFLPRKFCMIPLEINFRSCLLRVKILLVLRIKFRLVQYEYYY